MKLITLTNIKQKKSAKKKKNPNYIISQKQKKKGENINKIFK